MLTVSRHNSFMLYLCTLLVTALLACAPQNTGEKQSRVFQQGGIPQPTLLRSCSDFDLNWMGQEFELGAKIGAGVSGTVYALRLVDQESDDYVVKVMGSLTKEKAFIEVTDEVRVFNDFAGFFAPTWYKGLYEFRGEGDFRGFYSLAIKKRVIGPTAFEVIHDSELGLSPSTLFSKFIEFKFNLIKHMVYMAKHHQVYIWDLHLQNIMYDKVSKTWLFVDANRIEGFDAFVFKLKAIRDNPRNSKSREFYNDLITLLTKNREEQDAAFFDSYLDFYLGGFEQHLRDEAEDFPGGLSGLFEVINN